MRAGGLHLLGGDGLDCLWGGEGKVILQNHKVHFLLKKVFPNRRQVFSQYTDLKQWFSAYLLIIFSFESTIEHENMDLQFGVFQFIFVVHSTGTANKKLN